MSCPSQPGPFSQPLTTLTQEQSMLRVHRNWPKMCMCFDPISIPLNYIWAKRFDRGSFHPQLRRWAHDPRLANQRAGGPHH